MNPNRNFFNANPNDKEHQGLPIKKPEIQTAFPYPFSAPNEQSLEGMGRLSEQTELVERVFNHMYTFFRAFKVMDCIPPSVLVQTADISITIREALTLITTQELSQVVLIDPDDFSIAGLLTYTDLITVLLKANGLKVTKTDFFNCSVREWREKVISDNNEGNDSIGIRSESSRSLDGSYSDPEEREGERNKNIGSSEGEEEEEDEDEGERVEKESEELKEQGILGNNNDWMSKKFILPEGTLRDVIGIRPSGSLWEAITLMMNYSIRKLPVVDKEGHTIYVLTDSIILSCLVLRCDFSNPIFSVRVGDLNIGQFEGVHTCQYSTNMLEVLTTFLGSGVTFIPIVDGNDSIVDVFTKADLLNLVQMILNTTNPLLFVERNDNSKEDLILLEEINVKDVCEHRKKSDDSKRNQHQNLQQRNNSNNLPLHSTGGGPNSTTTPTTDVLRFTTKKSESFGRLLRHLTGTKIKHLVCISEDERKMKMEGIISCDDIFKFLIKHYKEVE